MPAAVWQGIWIPFLGTTLGAAGVFFLRRELPLWVQRALTGFAAGVMVAASIWSLLLPAMEQAAELGPWSFWPAVAGFLAGYSLFTRIRPGDPSFTPGEPGSRRHQIRVW